MRMHFLAWGVVLALLTTFGLRSAVSDMLGHGTVGLTLDTYSHLLPAMH